MTSTQNNFCEIFYLKNLVKENTCFKSQENPTCIDLILANRCRSFQNTHAIETGLSDFHKMTLTVLKTSFKKKLPKIVSYRDYKNLWNDNFIFNKHVPIKLKYIRANDGPFMNKELRKEIMIRSKLKYKWMHLFWLTKSSVTNALLS